MAEEFNQGGVCGGKYWWNSSRNLFASSPCSMAINDDAGSFGWPNNQDHLILDTKTTRPSSDDSAGSASDDSTLQMILNSSSTTSDNVIWNNQDIVLHDNGRSDENYSNILQEINGLNSSMNNYQNSPQNSKNYCDDPLINSFKQVNQSIIPDLDQPLNCITNSTTDCVASTCQELLSPNFPLNSASYSLLQTLFDTDSQTEQSLLDKYQPMNYSINSNEFLPGFTNASTPLVKPSFAKQQPAMNHHHLPNFTNTTPFWNATAAPLSNGRTSFLPATQSQFLPSSLNNKKPNLPTFSSKRHNEEGRDIASVAKKASNEPAFKRHRIETPSPLPTFKVRKEKLGDRITALQQLVSPFGKTDTASVLHEAIEYIKFLHDQVSVLSTPYIKNGSLPLQRQQAGDKLIKDQEVQKQDLKSRGLCLVPISSTFPVAAGTSSDFWTPTFGGSFK